MRQVMQAAGFLALGGLLALSQTALLSVVPIYPFVPNLMIPIVIYLGVSPAVPLLVGASVSLILGYLVDSLCGMPIGLHAFTYVATYLLAKGAGLKLFLRGQLSELLLTFVVCFLVGCLEFAIRAIFEYPAPFPASIYINFLVLLAVSLITALLAPLVFFFARLVTDLTAGRGEHDRAV